MANVDKKECLINGVQYECRTCFDPGRNIYPLTNEASNKKTWLELLKDIAKLQTNDEEQLPKTLCCTCSEKLKQAYEFILQIQEVTEKYSELLAKNDFLNHTDNIADCLAESAIALPLEEYVPEIKMEDDMVMSYDMDMNSKSGGDNEENFENEDNDDPFTETFDAEKSTESLDKKESEIETGEIATKRKLRKQTGASSGNVLKKRVKRSRKAKATKTDNVQIKDEIAKPVDIGANGPIVCAKCPQTFFTLYAHLKHQKEIHSSVPFDDEKGKCPLCSKKFKNKFYVMDHIKNVHDKLKPFKCAHCTKTFATAGARKNHEITHTDDFPHKCEYCGKRFRLMGKLKCHLQIHTTKPELLCPICKRGLKSEEELEAHIRNHEDNRLQCPSCGKLFTRKPNLTEHYNAVHLKLRPYKCGYCDQSFGDRKSRRTHEKRHQKKDISAL